MISNRIAIDPSWQRIFTFSRSSQDKSYIKQPTWIVAILVCTIFLSGCASILPTRKSARPLEKHAPDTGLIKPRIADSKDSATPKLDNEKNKQLETERENSDLHTTANKTSADNKVTSAAEPRETSRASGLVKPVQDAPKPRTNSSDDALPAKTEVFDPKENSKNATDNRKSESKEPESKKENDENEAAFKKHDHAKYMSTIRNKAIDEINKEKDVVLARMCRNSTTEEWTLTLYRKKQKTFSFVDYAWDEIDDKWEQSFVSDQRPTTSWKQHLEFSASDKECTLIKGNLP